MNTAPDVTSPFAMPGNYTLRLTVDGKQTSQPLTIKMDPRVKTNVNDLQTQHDVSVMCYNNAKKCIDALKEIEIKKDTSLATFEKEFPKYQNTFITILSVLQESDMPPTTQMITDAKKAEMDFEIVWGKWRKK